MQRRASGFHPGILSCPHSHCVCRASCTKLTPTICAGGERICSISSELKFSWKTRFETFALFAAPLPPIHVSSRSARVRIMPRKYCRNTVECIMPRKYWRNRLAAGGRGQRRHRQSSVCTAATTHFTYLTWLYIENSRQTAQFDHIAVLLQAAWARGGSPRE